MKTRASSTLHIGRSLSSSRNAFHINTHSRPGFTIVELLIVVVVIAILAAITIVAYNGITARTKAAGAASATEQAVKKIAAYAVTNAEEYPPALSAAGVADSGSTTYQYRVDNTASPKSYCVTATSSGISYWASNGSTTPARGACPGHGADGANVITNQFRNPTFDGPSSPENQSSATATIAVYNGSSMARGIATSTAFASIRLHPAQDRWAISMGQSVFGLATVCNAAPGARDFSLVLRYYDTIGGSLGTQLLAASSAGQTIAAGACLQLNMSSNAPAGSQSVGISITRGTSSAAIGDTFYVDNVLLTDQGSSFGAGNTAGWIWNGAPHNSTSTGPVL